MVSNEVTNLLITRRQILDSSKFKDFADDNFRFDENSRKLFKPLENTVGNGEIAHYEQFLLFPLCFQKAYFPGVSKGVIVWEWVKALFILIICIVRGYFQSYLLQISFSRSRKNEGIIILRYSFHQ